MSSGPRSFHSTDRLLTRIADHLYRRHLQVPMLIIGFLHAAVLCRIFRVFLHVVHRRVRDNACRSHRMTHMFGESDFAAPHLPRASIGPGEQKFVCAITF